MASDRGQHEIEMVIDDVDGDLISQPLEGFEQLPHDRMHEALERLVEDPGVAGQRTRHGNIR